MHPVPGSQAELSSQSTGPSDALEPQVKEGAPSHSGLGCVSVGRSPDLALIRLPEDQAQCSRLAPQHATTQSNQSSSRAAPPSRSA